MTNILHFAHYLGFEQTGPVARHCFGEQPLMVEKTPDDVTSLTVDQPQGLEPLQALPSAKPR